MRRTAASLGLIIAFTLGLVSPAFADSKYGAIAVSRNSGFARGAWNWSSQNGADSKALQLCRNASNASDCQVAVRFHQHRCGAVAIDNFTKQWSWGLGNNDNEARSNALRSLGGSNGKIMSSHCNDASTTSTGQSTTGAAIAGVLLGAAAVAALSHHGSKPAATPSPSAVYVPSTTTQVAQAPAYIPSAQTPAYVPGGTAAAAPATGYVPVAQRPYALVGVTTHVSDVVNALIPLYAPIAAGNVLQTAVNGQMVGGAGGTETVFQPAGGYVLTGLDVYRAPYKGNDEVVGLRLYWGKLTPTGIDAASGISSTVMATNAPPNLTAKTLRADPGTYISNLVVTPSTHPDGSTYVHDVAITTTAL